MKKIFILMFCIIFLVGTISAFDFDNVKDYDELNKKVTITNALGLGDKIAEAKLITPQINYVMPGKDRRVMILELENFGDLYSNALRELEILNLNENGNVESKNYHWEYAEYEDIIVEDYEEVCQNKKELNNSISKICERNLIGSHIEKKIKEWVDLTTKDIQKGKITIALVTNVKYGDYYDGIPTLFGKKIEEWAIWTAGFNTDLIAYWTFNESSGTTAYDSVNSYNVATQNGQQRGGGIINNSYYSGGNTQADTNIYPAQNSTISGWINRTGEWTNGMFFGHSENGATTEWYLQVDESENLDLWGSGRFAGCNILDMPIGLGEWTMVSVVQNTSGLTAYKNGVKHGSCADADALDSSIQIRLMEAYISATFYFLDNAVVDEIGVWNRTLTPSEITDLYNGGAGITYNANPIFSVNQNSPVDGYNTSSTSILFNCSVSSLPGTTLQNITLWTNNSGTFQREQTNNTLVGMNETIFNFTFSSGGNYLWGCSATDSDNDELASSNRTITIETTPPTILINYGNGTIEYADLDANHTINYTITDSNLNVCWREYNETNTTIPCTSGQINSTTFNLVLNNYSINIYANDSFGNLAKQFVEWDYNILQISQEFNSSTYETSRETFVTNISTIEDETIYNQRFWYDGNTYQGTKNDLGGNMFSLISSFDIPLINLTSTNISFVWEVTFQKPDDSFLTLNISSGTQNVKNISFEPCLYGDNFNMTLNFTAWNEETTTEQIKPYDFFGTFNYWLGSGSVYKNISITNLDKNYTAFCIAPHNKTYHTNAQIQYEKIGMVKRTYYIRNASISNNTQDISLYFLNNSVSQSFIIDVIDENQLPAKNLYVSIQRYYPGEGKSHVVEMGFTGSQGSTIGHFETETEEYNILIYDEGNLLYSSGNQKIFCRETPCTLNFQIGSTQLTNWNNFGDISGFEWTLDFNETTNIWRYVYVDTSGTLQTSRLIVYLDDPSSGRTNICNVSATDSASTLTCNVTSYSGNIFASPYLKVNDEEILVYLDSVIVDNVKNVFGAEGLFLSIFIILILAFAGLWNPIVGIMLVISGVVLLNFIQIASIGMTTIWGVICIALILMWEMKT